MKKRLASVYHRAEERGIALILTLAIITLVTLILVAFAVSMRVENAGSKSFNDLFKSRELALGAVDQAVATIRQATARGQPMPNGASGNILNYVTFPGGIYDFSGTLPATLVPLYSDPTLADPTNLNSGFWITGANGEFNVDTGSKFNVGWLYVAEDGFVGPPPLAGHGSLVGRFAFWVDDEASKINLNTAGTPTFFAPPAPDYGNSVSNEVDLSMLLPGMNTPAVIAAIRAQQASPGFTTIEEVKLADPTLADFTANVFSVTAYSNDANYPSYTDDLDALDQQRLVLANLHHTSPSDSDILGTAGNNTSNAYIRLSDAALKNVYSSSATPNAFKDKYTDAGLKQTIANMIAYQHDPQSTLAVDPQAYPPDDGTPIPTAPAFLGLAKTPYINEIQIEYISVDLGTTPASYSITRNVRVVLFYPYGADGSTYTTPASTEQITVDGLPTWVGSPFLAGPFTFTLPAGSLSGLPTASSAYSTPYLVQLDGPVTVPGSLNVTALAATPTITYARQYSGVPHRLDYAQTSITAKKLVASGKFYQYSVAQDPAVNDTSSEWTPLTASGSLPATQNSTYPSGHDITKVVMRAAPIQSIGELGYIHTPTPWQHLTLQPGGGNTVANQIPDWAMLDLFTVGDTVIPNESVTGGRININSFINPGASPVTLTTPRLVPLNALLSSISSVINPATVAPQIYGDTGRTDTYGMRDPGPAGDPIFDTIGELCEIPTLAGTATTDAGKEAAIRRIGNLITVRSNTFTIWVIADSIKEPKFAAGQSLGSYQSGIDVLTGEVRAQVVVERYETTPGVPNSAPKFRVRYFRYLYN